MNITGFWDSLVDCICRPPRDEYDCNRDLVGGARGAFRVATFLGRREDSVIINKQGLKLQCSHYIPVNARGVDGKLPCVLYCHCNSGSRRDAEEAICVLIPLGVSVFTLDFAGSGLSEGKWVTLGSNEVEDVEVAINHLRNSGKVSTVGLWGRSMGAVTALLYSHRDPSIAGMVLDSPFSRLTDLMLEIVEEQRLPIPKALQRMALGMMRRSVKKRAGFDVEQVAPLDVVGKSFIPALFGHAHGDTFIKIHHSERIYEAYAGDKNLIRFEGDHNSRRSEFFYNSASIFFHNVLQLDSMLEGGNPLNNEVMRVYGSASQLEGDVPGSPRSPGSHVVGATAGPWERTWGRGLTETQSSRGQPGQPVSAESTGGRDPSGGAPSEGQLQGAVHQAHYLSEDWPSTAEDEEAQLMAALQMSLMDIQGSSSNSNSSGDGAAARAGSARTSSAGGAGRGPGQPPQSSAVAMQNGKMLIITPPGELDRQQTCSSTSATPPISGVVNSLGGLPSPVTLISEDDPSVAAARLSSNPFVRDPVLDYLPAISEEEALRQAVELSLRDAQVMAQSQPTATGGGAAPSNYVDLLCSELGAGVQQQQPSK